ncbi:MAG: hypothetical protein IJF22_03220 [Clostridia bacterium]|nr:hypothetical protein [Clostridia bacterium]
MKKILCFFSAICLALGIFAFGMPTQRVFCDEVPTELNQSKFVSELQQEEKSATKYVLTSDILLTEWETVDLSGITLDGNGFTVTTPAPLFGVVSAGSVVKNLGVIASENFEFNASNQVTNFGLVALVVQSATFANVYAETSSVPENATEQDKINNTYGNLSVNLSSSAKVGGMFGVVENNSIIKNCYTKTKLTVVQNDANAQTTLVGGFVGEVQSGAIITNCYAVPKDTKLVEASFKDGLVMQNGKMIVGGFAGKVNASTAQISNVFVGGTLPDSFETEGKKLLVGKIVGELGLLSDSQFESIYTFNQNPVLLLVGSGSVQSDAVKYLPENTFTLINNFAPNFKLEGEKIWNDIDGWDTQTTWCKKTVSNYPVLQVFQTFSVSINTDKNSLGVRLEILDHEGNVFTTKQLDENEQEVDVPASKVEVKYNSQISFRLIITEDFLPYKAVKNLTCNNTEIVSSFDLEDNLKEATVPLVVTGQTSGVYFANSQDIKYNLKVVSDNENQGKVRVKGATASIDPTKPFELTYLSTQSFVAVSSNNSYTFEKWVWMSENGENEIDAFVGNPEEEKNSAQGITIKFGESLFESDEYTYVYMTSVAAANIPCVASEGVVTFTLKAKFTTHNEDLSIVLTANIASAEIYISDIFVVGNEEIDGVNFTNRITIGVPVEVRIEVAEGYKFVGWRVLNQSLSALIDSQGGETEGSTTIHLTLNGPTTIYADVVKEEVQTMDLSWLWYVLGGIGGALVIAGIVVIVVKRKRQESFIDFY